MKDYKLILAGLVLLLLIILIGVFTWLWISNRKNMDPLPIMASENQQSATDIEKNANSTANNILYVQAEEKLQVPLDDVIIRFESRHPAVQVLAHYVPTQSLFDSSVTSISDAKPSLSMVNIDVIIADDRITQARLSHLQALLNNAQTELNQSQVNANDRAQDNQNIVNVDPATSTDSNEAQHLASFSYALKGKQAVDGVILTDNPVAINFRNFLLSSAGQDILKEYDYDDIDGYKNSMDDLFNPALNVEKTSMEVADVLSNSK